MSQGTVKWFNSQKGYGFIEQENGKDIFIHQNEVTGFINEGDLVDFEIGQGQKGPCALKVKKAAEIAAEKKAATAKKATPKPKGRRKK